ncbi:MAG: DUF695 domain-containing protein [Clostridia bacterium]|nr:DUF695 domain-containing protein [Clostridia bacterium]
MRYPKNWIKYDWETDGMPAVFELDMDLYDIAPSPTHDTLFYVVCEPASITASMQSRGYRAKCEAAMRRCLAIGSQKLAGVISTSEFLQFYTYGTDLHALADIEDAARSVRGIVTRAGAQREPKWQTYMRLLYPDAAKFQTVRNAEQIELMRKCKDLLYPSRKLNLHVYLKTEPLRLLFEEQARLSGFAVGKPEFDDRSPRPYGVCLHIISSLNKREVDAVTTRVVRLAQQYEGALVGWDCALMKRTKLM